MAQDTREAVEQFLRPVEPAAAAEGAGRRPALACECADCGAGFMRKTTKGPRPRRCQKCAKAAHAALQAARAARKRGQRANGGTVPAAPEPAPDPPVKPRDQKHVAPSPAPDRPPERPQCVYCEDPFEPKDENQRYCSSECKLAARSDRRNRPAVPGNDKGYVAAMQAAGGRF